MIKILLVVGILSAVSGAVTGGPNGRIMGGHEAKIEDYPYALQLHYMGNLECGGILISYNHALTAGHCVFDKNTEEFLIYAGTTTLAEGGQALTIREITYHPKFVMLNNKYDAAILLLSDTISVPTASPAILANDTSAITEGATIIIVGWGWKVRKNNAEPTPSLRYTDLSILGDKQCKKSYDRPAITEEMFCANYTGNEVKDFCWGDYGGPAVMDGVLQGIISWGDSCGDGYSGKVFVNISKIRNWIKSVIGLKY